MVEIDKRWLYLVLFLAVFVPMLRPLGLPVDVGKWSSDVFKAVEALPPGSVVLLSTDFTPSAEGEVGATRDVIAKHLVSRGLKAVLVSFVPQGVRQADMVAAIYEAAGKRSGVDFVNLGYVPGGETGIAAFFADIKKTCPSDTKGVPVEQIPLLQGLDTIEGISLIIQFHTTVPGAHEYVRQLVPYGVPLAIVISTGAMATVTVYVQAGQAVGILGGLQAAAEYEKLTGFLGAATKAMDSQSMGYLVFISAIVLGNVFYFAGKRAASRSGAAGGKRI